MDKNTHVYCTECKWLRLDDEAIPYCVWSDECNDWNCEDRKPFKERPHYEERRIT
jgi:hypothetical protein